MVKSRLFSSKIKLATALGVNRTSLQNWEAAGLKLGNRGPYDVLVVTRWLIERSAGVADEDLTAKKVVERSASCGWSAITSKRSSSRSKAGWFPR